MQYDGTSALVLGFKILVAAEKGEKLIMSLLYMGANCWVFAKQGLLGNGVLHNRC